MAVWAPMHTTRWGLLSQPDKQKLTSPPSIACITFASHWANSASSFAIAAAVRRARPVCNCLVSLQLSRTQQTLCGKAIVTS